MNTMEYTIPTVFRLGLRPIWNTFPVFRAPCEGRLGPCEKADSVHGKNRMGRGQHTHNPWTDIATTRPNRPSGPIL